MTCNISPPKKSFLNRLKIIILFTNFELGGAERQGILLARYLKDQCGADVAVWGLGSEPNLASELCDEYGISWRCISFRNPQTKLQWLIELAYFLLVLRREKPDILLPYTVLPNLICGLTWRLSGAQYCVWNQSDEGLSLSTSILERLAVKWTPAFISNSTGGAEFLKRTYGLRPEQVAVIHNGVQLVPSMKDRNSWRKQLNVSDDCFVVGMVANLTRNKDHTTVIRAWCKVLDSWPSEEEKPLLLLAGRLDENYNYCAALIEELGLNQTVHILGTVNDVTGFNEAIDLCVYSSKSEGIPNGILEAMAVGLPVVATDIPGIREAVGKSGIPFLAPPSDYVSLANKILLMRNAGLRGKLGDILKNRIEKKFMLKIMCETTVKYLVRENK